MQSRRHQMMQLCLPRPVASSRGSGVEKGGTLHVKSSLHGGKRIKLAGLKAALRDHRVIFSRAAKQTAAAVADEKQEVMLTQYSPSVNSFENRAIYLGVSVADSGTVSGSVPRQVPNE